MAKHQCKRVSSAPFSEYHYRGYAITKFEFDDHWNIGEINGLVFDASQTKADSKVMIDKIVSEA